MTTAFAEPQTLSAAAVGTTGAATDATTDATPVAATGTEAVFAAEVVRHQAALRDQGLTVFRDLITPDQLAAMRRTIDAHLADPVRTGVNMVAWDRSFADIACHPLLLTTIEGLIGEDCILSSANLGARQPDTPRQGLHRDTGIWGESLPFMPFPVGIQTAWCIDDFTIENGATHVVPGSHDDPTVEGGGELQVVAPAGSVIAFDCQALHSGGANRTQVARRGVLTLYIRSWLKPQTDHRHSWSAEQIASASPQMCRLLGLQRQSPYERPDGTLAYVHGTGASNFYGGALSGPTGY